MIEGILIHSLASTTGDATAAAASGTPASTGAAMALSAHTMPYMLVPLLAGFFAFCL